MSKRLRYKDAGVDIEAGEEAVGRIKALVRTTFTPGVLTDVGQFGGFFSFDPSEYDEPVLVSSIDGVGTKLKVASMAGRHDTVGEDLVNHCVNDILAGGARPLFFLDYIGTGVLFPGVVEEIIAGMVRGCRQTNCALIGGEMAEMPGFYRAGEYDVAGCVVGIVEKGKIINGQTIAHGDVLVGLPSNGLHTNGYSLARKVLFDLENLDVGSYVEELGTTVGDELLRVHRAYLSVTIPILDRLDIKGMSHVTGGGIVGNTNRILPEGLTLEIDWKAWEVPAVFRIIQERGHVPEDDMRRTFNMGIGYIFVVGADTSHALIESLESAGEKPIIVGTVVRTP